MRRMVLTKDWFTGKDILNAIAQLKKVEICICVMCSDYTFWFSPYIYIYILNKNESPNVLLRAKLENHLPNSVIYFCMFSL